MAKYVESKRSLFFFFTCANRIKLYLLLIKTGDRRHITFSLKLTNGPNKLECYIAQGWDKHSSLLGSIDELETKESAVNTTLSAFEAPSLFFCGNGRTQTYDLRMVRHIFYHCATTLTIVTALLSSLSLKSSYALSVWKRQTL
jgi:hypothetical protein